MVWMAWLKLCRVADRPVEEFANMLLMLFANPLTVLN